MKKRLLSTILGTAMLASVFSGSSMVAHAEEPVTLTWAVFETDNYTAEVWQTIIDAFEADNPGIKIEKVLMTGDSRPAFLKSMNAAGNMPDINIDPVDLAATDGIYAEVPEELLEKYEEASIATYNGTPVSRVYCRLMIVFHRQFIHCLLNIYQKYKRFMGDI